VDTPAQVILSQARSQLDAQEQSLDRLRNRAATVLASAGIVATFFATSSGHPNLLLAGSSIFGLGAVLGVALLLPVYSFEYAGNLQAQINWAKNASPEQGDQLGLLFAEGLEGQRVRNRGKLSVLILVFAAQCALLGAQVIVEAIARGLG
jgi:hypothetical protein